MHNTRLSKERKVERRQVTPAPVYVSQLTVLALVGIDALRYLELLRDHPEVRRAKVGKLRLVALDDLRELLDKLAHEDGAGGARGEPGAGGHDRTPTDVDAVLASIGRKRTA